MKAVILAAGRGIRLGALTESIPTCMVPVGGKPLLRWQLEALRGAGVDDIAIVGGYKAEAIEAQGVFPLYNPRWNETNMAYSLLCASDWLNMEGFMLSYSNIIYPAGTIRKLMETPGDITVPYNTEWRKLWEARFKDPLQDAESFQSDEYGLLKEIGQKAASFDGIQGRFMGLLKCEPIGWSWMKSILDNSPEHILDNMDITALIQCLAHGGILIHTTPIQGQWFECRNPDDIPLFNRMAGEHWLAAPDTGAFKSRVPDVSQAPSMVEIQHKDQQRQPRIFHFNFSSQNALSSLALHIITNKYRYVMVGGDQALYRNLSELFLKSGKIPRKPRFKFSIYPFDFRDGGIDLAVLNYAPNGVMMTALRLIINLCRYSGDVLIPDSAGSCETPVHWPFSFENPRPILAYGFPFAGSGRFWPPLKKILQTYDWNIFEGPPYHHNTRFSSSLMTGQGIKVPPQNEIDDVIRARALSLDYNEAAMIHDLITLPRFADLDCSVAVLMRDPRDIINSLYHHDLQFGNIQKRDLSKRNPFDKETWMRDTLHGITNVQMKNTHRIFHWHNIKTITDNFLFALQCPNMYVMRFEDMHANHAEALKNLVTCMGIHPNPLAPLGDEDFKAAAYLGSFEHQTNGQKTRADSNPAKANFVGSCRKGVPGDWRSSFTPSTVKLFKELTGGALVRLGYEKDTDWGL